MADGKVVIETDLDSSGIEKGLKNTEKSMKAQAATLAAEYRKQGMNASDAFKKRGVKLSDHLVCRQLLHISIGSGRVSASVVQWNA